MFNFSLVLAALRGIHFRIAECPVLIKGTLSSAVRRVLTKPQVDDAGNTTGQIDTYRTRYEMNVRCLCSSGAIENYTSAEPAEADDADAIE